MNDITIVMLTANKVPKAWSEYHKIKLLEAADGAPIVTVSKEPLDWGVNVIQEGYSIQNIYTQMLKVAKMIDTPYMAIADDDTLYTKEHFAFRPKEKGFFYNMTRWHLLTWGDAFYFYKPLPGNGLFMGTTKEIIKALENRFAYSAELPGHLLHELGVRRDALFCDEIKWRGYNTVEPVVSFYHEQSLDPANRNRTKKVWPVRALDIPVWGHANELRKLWN